MRFYGIENRIKWDLKCRNDDFFRKNGMTWEMNILTYGDLSNQKLWILTGWTWRIYRQPIGVENFCLGFFASSYLGLFSVSLLDMMKYFTAISGYPHIIFLALISYECLWLNMIDYVYINIMCICLDDLGCLSQLPCDWSNSGKQ
jgi:hypothetical protein